MLNLTKKLVTIPSARWMNVSNRFGDTGSTKSGGSGAGKGSGGSAGGSSAGTTGEASGGGSASGSARGAGASASGGGPGGPGGRSSGDIAPEKRHFQLHIHWHYVSRANKQLRRLKTKIAAESATEHLQNCHLENQYKLHHCRAKTLPAAVPWQRGTALLQGS